VASALAVILACLVVCAIDRRFPARSYFDLAFGFTVCFFFLRFLLRLAARALAPVAKPRVWGAVAGLGVLVILYRAAGQYWLAFIASGAALVFAGLVVPNGGRQKRLSNPPEQVPGDPDSELAVATVGELDRGNLAVALWDNAVYRLIAKGERERLQGVLTVLKLRNEIMEQARVAYAKRSAWTRAKQEEAARDEQANLASIAAQEERLTAETMGPLRREIQRAQAEAELAEAQKKIRDLKTSAPAQPKLSPEEQNAKRHAAAEAKLATLRSTRQEALKIADEDERIRRMNAIDDVYDTAIEEWAKTL